MKTVYCSTALRGDRRRGWRELIGELYAPLDIDIPAREDFFGRICRSMLGEVELTEVLTDSEFASRTARHIARDQREYYLFVLVRAGQLSFSQFDRECLLRPGEFTLGHLNSPYLFRHNARVEKIGVKIPATMLRARASDLARHCAVPRRADIGVARLAASFANSLCNESGTLADGDAGYRLSATAADLFGILFTSGEPLALPDDSAVRAALRRRCKSYIEAHWSDADLSPATIAAALGISVRYLHRCFASSHLSVMDHVREQRLRQSQIDLTDARCDRLPIAEIALRNGFRNVCHFNEVFKTQFGVTPREMRRDRRRRACWQSATNRLA